jgi:cell wall-associated NlpC family hydrolase
MSSLIEERVEFVKGLIGKPWQANAKGPEAYDCWHLVRYVLSEYFKKEVPDIQVPENPTWPWMIETFRSHSERRRWKEVQGLLLVPDGSICLMARHNNPAHCGVVFKPEMMILHCDQKSGVVFQDTIDLKMEGWAKLRFYVPE